MAILQVNKVSKLFGTNPEQGIQLLEQGWGKTRIAKEKNITVGVNRVSFDIHEGEIFVIMGLSGSGKSTLVRLLNRLIEPTSGEILIHGKDLRKMNKEQLREVRRKKISMVFQKFALFPHRSVVENVEYGLEIQKVDKSKRREAAMKSLELVGLKGWEEKMPDQLSGGMQQRVGLARALANDPEILLMDEAFSALDPLIRRDMQDELIELQDKMKKTIVFITHDLDEALRIGDRIALMKDGSIVQIGTPEEILTQPANDYVERFVEDVDLSKVLTASRVMRRPETITMDRGPRVALELMRERGISNLFVIDRSKKLLGVITAEDASDAMKNNRKLEDILITDGPSVGPDTLLNELFEITSMSKVPLAVVDDNGRLMGVIVRGAVLGALAGESKSGEVTQDA
ncbi:glycine betaine/L-proline ABC transporter, ATPase subunit [Paenibacillus vortex V453]|uniref:Quaternary amine transport ATP-binding protein n=2 Tax=Paenibacillus TaxID=44249 RepID=A0A163FY82_9BACL|nr:MULTISPECIES: betaine/proline/choline family ABC transporter ATP-binding protein [Paenibacillus]MCA4756908.1 glycine betaine/L-proline ABC transporter ATP-binding protein [Mycolicibacterium fortuitum]ANA79222.1 glycine/betaine ABC transporter ATP-binding protein [Paenibacillus glucanolyticus]AVV56849.1 glycine betaine/L-proline ABC transporter ATP-binding protein [Paenibacillus glucanolyticus]AWP26005.1 glycine/betaine ABC transporter ATP-binding protein [Paenibacillus sp. Cedars]EFU38752.1